MGKTAERVKEIIRDQLGVKKSEAIDLANIREDLGADSFDRIDLLIRLEEEFNIEIPDDDFDNCKTVDDLVGYVEKKAGAEHSGN